MPDFNVVIAVLVAMSLILFFFGAAVAIRKSLKNSGHYRGILEQRLEKRPFAKLLEALDIDTRGYVSQRPVPQVERHLRRCEACGEKQACDRDVASGAVARAAAYCPNYEDLSAPQAA